MKFLTHKDGDVEHDGAVFEPFETAYRDARTQNQKCRAILRVYNANKSRYLDKNHWATVQALPNTGTERVNLMIACASNRLALQEALTGLEEDEDRLKLYMEALQRHIRDDRPEGGLAYLGMNNCVLGVKLAQTIARSRTQIQVALQTDPTNGLGMKALADAYRRYVSWLRQTSGGEEPMPCLPQPTSLSYVENCYGYCLSTDTAGLARSVNDCLDLVARAREVHQRLIAACKICNEPQYAQRERGDQEKEYALELAQSIKRTEAVSCRLELKPLIKQLHAVTVRAECRAVLKRYANQLLHERLRPQMANALFNNVLYAGALDREITLMLQDELPVTDSIKEYEALDLLFKGELSLAALRDDTP